MALETDTEEHRRFQIGMVSRRTILKTGSVGLIGLAGCAEAGDGGDGGDEVVRITADCTAASINEFEWKEGAGEVHATIVNEGDVAGDVIVEVRFWRSENEVSEQGSVRWSVPIDGHETRELTLDVTAPTAKTHWASMVVKQDCQ